MRWKIADAKKRFSEVLRAAVREPQLILNRERVVAAIVEASAFEAYESWRAGEQRRTLAESFAELRALCAEEGYRLDVGQRVDRPNAFTDGLVDPAL